MEEEQVLCVANAYLKKYYFNEDFAILPQQIKDELQILCVTYTEEIGGVFTLLFDEEGNLQMRTEASDVDGFYDEIGAELKIKQIRQEKEELFRSLELFYQTFC